MGVTSAETAERESKKKKLQLSAVWEKSRSSSSIEQTTLLTGRAFSTAYSKIHLKRTKLNELLRTEEERLNLL